MLSCIFNIYDIRKNPRIIRIKENFTILVKINEFALLEKGFEDITTK